jgi:hypothetical protein
MELKLVTLKVLALGYRSRVLMANAFARGRPIARLALSGQERASQTLLPQTPQTYAANFRFM